MKWAQLTLADENFIDEYSNGDGTFKRDFLIKPKSLSPYQVYKTFKEEFGPPNSKILDAPKIQWQYTLQSPDAYFEIYDWKMFTWSIGVYLKKGVTGSAEDVANKLIRSIENQTSRYNSIIKKKLKNPDGIVIENPFVTYRETANSIYSLQKELKESKQNEDEKIDLEGYMRHYDLCRAGFIMYLSSVEGFINLVYEIYLRKELREKRIYDRIYREQIDLKLRLAPVYCECFREDVLYSNSEAFKEFHSLAQLRNDFVHANLTKPMMNPVVYEDGIEFVIDSDSTTAIGIPNNFSEFESCHVLRAKEITQNLIDYVIHAMAPRYRREFEYVMDQELINVEYEDGQIYILNR
ncbi:MAG: hypothetical protein D3904_07575 [Candidatus Electrothrix sp. EH2]|nr:hypothetical protein [Candidatus Electrothrix sp. EH2]